MPGVMAAGSVPQVRMQLLQGVAPSDSNTHNLILSVTVPSFALVSGCRQPYACGRACITVLGVLLLSDVRSSLQFTVTAGKFSFDNGDAEATEFPRPPPHIPGLLKQLAQTCFCRTPGTLFELCCGTVGGLPGAAKCARPWCGESPGGQGSV